MSDSLHCFRDALVKNLTPKLALDEEGLEETASVVAAKYLNIPTEGPVTSRSFDLDEETVFVVDSNKQKLRVVVQCWLHQNSSATDYINDCEEKKIPTITFLQRTDLITWLIGASDESEYIKRGADESLLAGINAGDDAVTKKAKIEDPFFAAILQNERNLIDHNSSLKGNKMINFASVARDCENRIIKPLKHKKPATSSSSAASRPSSSSASTGSSDVKAKPKAKDPIIIISPSSSALLTMSNVKEFLQNGTFEDPAGLPKSSENLLLLSRKSERLGSMRFLVVDNIEKFTKPEYWDRVVAIFTTGQRWQFKQYKYNDPQELFQRYKGFFVCYNGDVVPQQIKEWNVASISLDRTRRFKDKQIVESFWDNLEKHMLQRGFARR